MACLLNCGNFLGDCTLAFMILAVVLLLMGLLISYILASGFLLVESFRQLFLDAAAYQLPSFSNYWPHFM